MPLALDGIAAEGLTRAEVAGLVQPPAEVAEAVAGDAALVPESRRLADLISAHGTLTAALESLGHDTVGARVDTQHDTVFAESVTMLEAHAGEPALRRDAVLVDARERPLVRARSVLLADRLPPGAVADLRRRRLPIGRLLARHGVHYERRGVRQWREKASPPPATVFVNAYLMVSGGSPVAVIAERLLVPLRPTGRPTSSPARWDSPS